MNCQPPWKFKCDIHHPFDVLADVENVQFTIMKVRYNQLCSPLLWTRNCTSGTCRRIKTREKKLNKLKSTWRASASSLRDPCQAVSHAAFCSQDSDRSEANPRRSRSFNSITRSQTLEVNNTILVLSPPPSQPYLLHPSPLWQQQNRLAPCIYQANAITFRTNEVCCD